MAVRYVKDFEFPSAAGYTKSAPSKVTGQMFAKGGRVRYEDGGMAEEPTDMGAPRQQQQAPQLSPQQRRQLEMQQAAKRRMMIAQQAQGQGAMSDADMRQMGGMQQAYPGQQYKKGGKVSKAKGGDVESVSVKDIKSGKIKQSTDEDFYGRAKEPPMPPRRPAGLKKGGYAEGGPKKPAPLTAEEREDLARKDQARGVKLMLDPQTKAKGGAVHDDAAEDKKMIKSMIKPSALKKATGGPAVQMAKSNAISDSLRGQKKMGYADGGKAKGKMSSMLGDENAGALAALSAGRPPAAVPARSVPVASQAPVIPQRVSTDIGVGKSRTGKPNVGAIRAAMAKKASMAAPETAPAVMKKGGKVGC